jgi:hypothetical protein
MSTFIQGRQRKFEIQIQGRLKAEVEGTLYMGGELQRKLQLGLVTRTLTSGILAKPRKLIASSAYRAKQW